MASDEPEFEKGLEKRVFEQMAADPAMAAKIENAAKVAPLLQELEAIFGRAVFDSRRAGNLTLHGVRFEGIIVFPKIKLAGRHKKIAVGAADTQEPANAVRQLYNLVAGAAFAGNDDALVFTQRGQRVLYNDGKNGKPKGFSVI
ncbi:MAG: hypothetical protein KGQ41_04945 [Alphaproteobacteria bacterium]|nr:hypothetical protein [Alphaproteobacteria bacterium]